MNNDPTEKKLCYYVLPRAIHEVITSGRNASYSGQSLSQAARESSGQENFRQEIE